MLISESKKRKIDDINQNDNKVKTNAIAEIIVIVRLWNTLARLCLNQMFRRGKQQSFRLKVAKGFQKE
jgi:hypothetical protein